MLVSILVYGQAKNGRKALALTVDIINIAKEKQKHKQAKNLNKKWENSKNEQTSASTFN